MFVPEVAEQFQLHGITALIYDPRSIGTSDGTPRNEIDPPKQVEDYSDALTFLRSLPIVDSKAVGFWGMSFSATVALSASIFDKRAKFVIAVCPLLIFDEFPAKHTLIFAKAMQDRESQLRGNDPFYLPMMNSKGESPFPGMVMGMDGNEEVFRSIMSAKDRIPTFQNRTTIQSWYKMIQWQPMGVMQHVSPTPVMLVVPELDQVSPPERQIALCESCTGRKKLHVAEGKGHLNVLSGPEFESLMKLQADWLKAELEENS